MLGLLHLARWEWFRLRQRGGFVTLASLALLLAALLLAVAVAQNLWDWIPGAELTYFRMAGGGLSAVTPFLAILLAVLVYAVDLQGGNCRTLAARGAHRGVILAGKALVSLIVLLAYHLATFLLACLPALLLEPGFSGWDEGLVGGAASLLNGLLYLALGILLCHWRESTAFAVGVGIAFIVFESVGYPIAGAIGQTADWPLAEITAWTLWGVANGLQGDNEALARPWYIPIVTGYAAVLVAAALARFLRADLRAGGE